jgi:hypothetical protein
MLAVALVPRSQAHNCLARLAINTSAHAARAHSWAVAGGEAWEASGGREGWKQVYETRLETARQPMARRRETRRCAIAARGTPPEIELALLRALSIIVADDSATAIFWISNNSGRRRARCTRPLHRPAATPLCLAGWVHTPHLISRRLISSPSLAWHRPLSCRLHVNQNVPPRTVTVSASNSPVKRSSLEQHRGAGQSTVHRCSAHWLHLRHSTGLF